MSVTAIVMECYLSRQTRKDNFTTKNIMMSVTAIVMECYLNKQTDEKR